ncbi:metallophosphoesterase 1 isoform X2 [Castor canadensis]|uniref:Metallophosphoesterase 1 isoform X2 n=1 Tax=Castor canadensis TaxID=51338 RepID=A0AC58MAQ3_CASCN
MRKPFGMLQPCFCNTKTKGASGVRVPQVSWCRAPFWSARVSEALRAAVEAGEEARVEDGEAGSGPRLSWGFLGRREGGDAGARGHRPRLLPAPPRAPARRARARRPLRSRGCAPQFAARSPRRPSASGPGADGGRRAARKGHSSERGAGTPAAADKRTGSRRDLELRATARLGPRAGDRTPRAAQRPGNADECALVWSRCLLGALGCLSLPVVFFKREWQMERAFQTALWWLQPEVIFILGDIFDEGKWSSSQAWADDVQRFQKMFRHPSHMQLKVVAGNHDIGFHYQMSEYRVKRFEKVFSPERLFSWKGVNFVMVNSVALEGDGCDICSQAEAELVEISHKLNCSREVQGSDQCGDGQWLPWSAPVLLQHYPLYRISDANCSGDDAAPPEERSIPFEERYDVLSREASQKLLWWLQPRLVLSGHTHSACEVLHAGGVPEISIPSFSWRNRNNPSFIMGSLTSRDYALSKCYLPFEDTVLTTYCGAAGFVLVLVLAHFECLASPFLFGWNLLRMPTPTTRFFLDLRELPSKPWQWAEQETTAA